MAQNLPAERGGSRQARQVAELRERAQPQDGVVAPVVALAQLPIRQPAREHRAAQARRELHEPGEQGLPARRHRQSLDDSGFRMRVHHPRQCHDCVAAHDAVRIQHHGVVVSTAPGAHEIRDVACLAADVVLAAPVKDPAACAVSFDQGLPGLLLGRADFRLARVRKNEQIEGRLLRVCAQGRPDDIEARRDAGRVLVVDRHDDRGPAVQRPARHLILMQDRGIAADEANHEARNRRPERARDPREQYEEQHEPGALEAGKAIRLENVIHQAARQRGRDQRQAKEQCSSAPCDAQKMSGCHVSGILGIPHAIRGPARRSRGRRAHAAGLGLLVR